MEEKNKNTQEALVIEQEQKIEKDVKKTIKRFHYSGDTKSYLETAIKLKKAVLLIGDTGTGKTESVKEIAKEKGIETVRISVNGQTGVDEIIGFKTLTPDPVTGTTVMGWVDGPVVTAMKEGKWVVLDELNMALPEVMASLHSLLDDDRRIYLKEKNNETVEPHENFRVFATMNPDDEYAGTKEMNKAFMDRFSLIIQYNYSEEEADIIRERTGCSEDVATRLVIFAKDIRQSKKNNEISFTLSTRSMIDCAEFVMNDMAFTDAVKLSIINKCRPEDKTKLETLAKMVFGKEFVFDIIGSSGSAKKSFDSIESIKNYVQEAFKKEEELAAKKLEIENKVVGIEEKIKDIVKEKQESEKKYQEKINTELKKTAKLNSYVKKVLDNANSLKSKYNMTDEDLDILICKRKKITRKTVVAGEVKEVEELVEDGTYEDTVRTLE